jgi:putative ABC transport system ATP-binding protein
MIEVRDLVMRLPSGPRTLTILDGITLSVPARQFVAITGPSGSGKSTLLGLIAGLDHPTAGSIRVDGSDLTVLGEDALARLRRDRVGYVFQAFFLIPTLTAVENVAIPLELAGHPDALARAAQLIAEVGLGGRGHHYPAQLSGGEQQRVALARAFANQPGLLLADEPTGNLDSATGAQIIDLLVARHRDHAATLVLVTHDAALARHAERVIELSDGRIIADHLNGTERTPPPGQPGPADPPGSAPVGGCGGGAAVAPPHGE